mgnify:CR=1 FL=1
MNEIKGVAETEEDKAVDADLKAITEDTPKRDGS